MNGITLSAVPPDTLCSGDFTPSVAFENLFFDISDNKLNWLIVGHDFGRMITTPVNMCAPNPGVIEAWKKVGHKKADEPDPFPDQDETKISWDVVPLKYVTDDEDFETGPLFSGMMAKCTKQGVELAYLQENTVLLKIPKAIIIPKFKAALNKSKTSGHNLLIQCYQAAQDKIRAAITSSLLQKAIRVAMTIFGAFIILDFTFDGIFDNVDVEATLDILLRGLTNMAT